MFGRIYGFFNLSGLHAFYAARLSRAYLGASNAGMDRVWAEASARYRSLGMGLAASTVSPRLATNGADGSDSLIDPAPA